MRRRAGRWLARWAAGGLLACAMPGMAPAGTVALTFDDLPVFGSPVSAAEGLAITDRLLAGIERHRWSAIGFVNEKQLDAPGHDLRARMLAHWLDAGMDLGNHSYSHPSLNTTPVADYIADVARDEAVTAPLLAQHGKRERWFRYPYLETGTTQEVRRTFETWLGAHGYKVAPVTMENSDWQFATPYDDALARGDDRRAAQIRIQYLDFTRRIVAWYEHAGQVLLGRQPAFVFLLHASRLNAASMDAFAGILARAHLRVVPLERAMRDPAYRIADTYVGPDGNEWLDRWARTLHRELPYDGIPLVPAAIVAEEKRLSALPAPPSPVPAGPKPAPEPGAMPAPR